VQSLYREN